MMITSAVGEISERTKNLKAPCFARSAISRSPFLCSHACSSSKPGAGTSRKKSERGLETSSAPAAFQRVGGHGSKPIDWQEASRACMSTGSITAAAASSDLVVAVCSRSHSTTSHIGIDRSFTYCITAAIGCSTTYTTMGCESV